jgi:nitrite reductase (NADH) small subunit
VAEPETPTVRTGEWSTVCTLAELEVGRGASALVNGHAVALFRTEDDEVFALGNRDPGSRDGLLSRGMVGVRDGIPFVGSTRHRRAFDLRSGHSLDGVGPSVPSYQVRLVDGVIQVGPRRAT